MKTDRVTVFDLFEKQRRYLVPIFQRGYVWTKEGQWEPLWEDIVDQATIVRESSATTRQSARKHFLGAIVLNQDSTQVRHVAATEIIDGQQRLMTLQILLAALRDVVSGIIGECPRLSQITSQATLAFQRRPKSFSRSGPHTPTRTTSAKS